MIDSGFLLYKCRRCGRIDKSYHIPHGMMALVSIDVNGKTPIEWGAMTASKTDICNCDDGNLGISDLIGFEYDEKEGE